MADIEELRTRIQQLETQLAQKTSVRITPQRKLERFSGKIVSKTDDWIEDAKAILCSVPEGDRLTFLLSHLEGTARREVTFAEDSDKDSVDKIFKILQENFGEKRTDAQLKTVLYERSQKSNETVRQFSRELLELVGKLKIQDDRDKILIEVFSENLLDTYVRREVKKKLKDQPAIKFSALRDFAIDLAEDEVEKSSSSLNNSDNSVKSVDNTVVSNVVGAEFKSMMESMLKCQESLASQQAELLKQLSNNVVGGADGNRTQGYRHKLRCWYCNRLGHTKKNCYKYAADMKKEQGQGTQAGNGSVPPSRQ